MSYQTLLRELKDIESSEFVHLDKNAEYREVIANWRSKNSLVEKAAIRKLYLPQEFDYFVKRVGGGRLYYPSSLSEEDSKELKEFNDVVGGIAGASLVENPITFGVAAGGLGGAFTYGVDKLCNDYVSRRDFLERFAIYAVVTGGGSALLKRPTEDEMSKKRNEVNYVQDKIEKFGRF
jgi:hypothetical protein